MNRERIERLAIDSAAGELNEDVEALFRAYLAEHPEANPAQDEMLQVYEQTKSAIDAKTKDADAGVGIPAVRARSLVRAKWWEFERYAAAVIVAAFIGFAGGRWAINGETSDIGFTQFGRAPTRIATVSDLKEQYAGTFWGDKALTLFEQRPGQRHKGDFKRVGFLQRYREYKKETQDE
jgi:hypothetical protein